MSLRRRKRGCVTCQKHGCPYQTLNFVRDGCSCSSAWRCTRGLRGLRVCDTVVRAGAEATDHACGGRPKAENTLMEMGGVVMEWALHVVAGVDA